jgi:hypothetical protein
MILKARLAGSSDMSGTTNQALGWFRSKFSYALRDITDI